MSSIELQDTLELTTEELRKIDVVGLHLNQWNNSKYPINTLLEKFGGVQLDPLNPAGRSHDFFFMSRIEEYKVMDFEKYVYPNKIIFEAYHGPLYALHMKYFPIFKDQLSKEWQFKRTDANGKSIQKFFNEKLQLVPGLDNKIVAHIEEHGSCSSSDLPAYEVQKNSKGRWRTGNLVNDLLYYFLWIGTLTISNRDENFRKYYNLIEHYIPSDIFVISAVNNMKFEQYKLRLKESPVSYLGNYKKLKSGVKKIRIKKNHNKEYIENNDTEHIMAQRETTDEIYLIPKNYEELLKQNFDGNMRALSPLEPLIYDRTKLELLWNFEYIWEVYTPVKKRRWGYYVYPLLFEDNLIGRLEAKYDKKKRELQIFNFQPEMSYDKTMESSLNELLERWKTYVGAKKLKISIK